MAKAKDRTELFERTPILRALAVLAVPTVFSQLVSVIYNLADTFWVGRLNDPLQNAAVTLVAPAMMAMNAVSNLFGTGSSSLMSRSLGAKEYEKVSVVSAFGFTCAVAMALLFSLICGTAKEPLLNILGAEEATRAASGAYLRWTVICGALPAVINTTMAHLVRSEGATFHASLGTMSGCFLNMALDPLFILPGGLNMGVEGAGLATFLSNCAACVYFAVLLTKKRGKTYVDVNPLHFAPRKEIVSGVFQVGVPSAVMNLLSVTGMTVLNNFTASYGAEAVAAMGICNKIYMVPLNVTYGIAQGAMPLIGYNYAAGGAKRVRSAIRTARAANLGFITLMGLLFFIFPRFWMGLFIADGTIIAHGAILLRVFSLALPLLSLDFFTVAVFQAVGMGKEAFVFAVLRKLVLEIPALFLFDRLWPLYGLPFAQVFAEAVLTAAAFWVLSRFYKKMNAKTAL
jgi:putative MATE family efflux protein